MTNIDWSMKTVVPIILLVAALSLGTWMGWKPISGPPLGPAMRVDFIDVGQGDSILISTPDNVHVLVDAGDEQHGDAVLDYLRANGVKKLDYVIMTTTHEEHIGGLNSVLEGCPVSAVLDGSRTDQGEVHYDVLRMISDRRIPYGELNADMNIALGKSAILEILAPERAHGPNGRADGTVVMRLAFGGARILLTSDIGREYEAKLIARHRDVSSQVLKVADYGSEQATSLELLRLVRPEFVVVSTGGHSGRNDTNRRAMERLSEERTAAALFRTDIDGTITLRTDGNRIVVEPER